MPIGNDNTNSAYNELWKDENIKEYKEAVFDRISELLIERFADTYGDNPVPIFSSIESYQKTWDAGSIKTGRESEEIMVVYQSDTEANMDDKNIIDSILNWLEFTHPKHIGLKFETTTKADGSSTKPSLVLTALGKEDKDISSLVSSTNLEDVSLKDNVSQFLNFIPTKTNIDKEKLSQHINIDFSELSPNTFTTFINNFQKSKNSLPFYRYRTEDFFEEYFSVQIPTDYFIEKFFGYFDLVVDDISIGELEDIESILAGVSAIKSETILYLISVCKKRLPEETLGEGDIPVEELVAEIKNVKEQLAACEASKDILQIEMDALEQQFAAASGNTAYSLSVSDPNSNNYDTNDDLYDPALDSASNEFDQDAYDDAVDDSNDGATTEFYEGKRNKLKRRRWFRK